MCTLAITIQTNEHIFYIFQLLVFLLWWKVPGCHVIEIYSIIKTRNELPGFFMGFKLKL